MGKATAPSGGGCWLRLASASATASASETTSASTSAAPAYIHNRRGWLRAACFAKMCVQCWKLVCQSCRRRCIHIFPSAFQSHTTRGINRLKERDTETVFDSKPSSPVQLHNLQDSFFYSFKTNKTHNQNGIQGA